MSRTSMRMVLFFGFASGTALSAQGTASPSAPTPQIVTTGVGEARIVPDRATIFIGLQTRAASASAAGAENARRQHAILDTLRALGLSSEQLATINYNVAPEMQYSPNGQTPPKVTGYTVTNTVRADVRRLEDVGRVIDASLAKGANEISSLNFYSSKADSVRRSAMSLAVQNARADAEVLAVAGGGRVGALLEISTSDQAPQPVIQRLSMAKAAARQTPVEAGEQAFSATVTVRWTFLPGR
jgi:uncharacterized protein